MTESVAARVRRLLSGSVEDLVDRMERGSNEMVMREAIREVDRAIEDTKSAHGHALLKRQQAQRHVTLATDKINDLKSKAAMAVRQNRDDLAEAAIARQLDLEAQIPLIQANVVEAGREAKELEDCVAALSGRKREMEADLNAYRTSVQSAADASGKSESHSKSATSRATQRTDRAQTAFHRAMSGTSGLAACSSEPDVHAKLAELDRIQRNSEITARLAALKGQQSAV
jgi:phage shock protein A